MIEVLFKGLVLGVLVGTVLAFIVSAIEYIVEISKAYKKDLDNRPLIHKAERSVPEPYYVSEYFDRMIHHWAEIDKWRKTNRWQKLLDEPIELRLGVEQPTKPTPVAIRNEEPDSMIDQSSATYLGRYNGISNQQINSDDYRELLRESIMSQQNCVPSVLYADNIKDASDILEMRSNRFDYTRNCWVSKKGERIHE